MSSSLMLNAGMAFLILTGAAEAKECYALVQDPSWTITDNGDVTFTWHRGGEAVELVTGSAGTGIPRRVASDLAANENHAYFFHKGDLIFDMDVYEPVSCD